MKPRGVAVRASRARDLDADADGTPKRIVPGDGRVAALAKSQSAAAIDNSYTIDVNTIG